MKTTRTPIDKAAASHAKELETLMREIRNREEASGLDHDARELKQMDQRHGQEIAKLRELGAQQVQLEEAQGLQKIERANLAAKQEYELMKKATAEALKQGEEELKLQRQNAEEYLKLQDKRYKCEARLLEYAAAYQEQKLHTTIAQAKAQVDSLTQGARGYNTGVGIMAAAMDDIVNLAAENTPEDKAIDAAYEHYMQLQEAHLDYTAHQKEIDVAHLQYIKACEDYNMKFQLSVTKGMFGMLSGIAMTIYEMSDKKCKEMFLAYKAFAIVETTISTYMAAYTAFDTAFEYYEEKTNPYVAAVIAAAYFALTLAAGLARVAAIMNQNYEGGSSVSSSMAGSVTIPTVAEEEEAEEEKAGTVAIEINIYGDVVDHDNTFYLKTVPYLNRIVDSRRTYVVNS